MALTELFIRLLFIFFPGIIGIFIISNLTTHHKWDFKFFLLYSYLLGMLSYFFLYIIVFISSKIALFFNSEYIPEVKFFNILNDTSNTLKTDFSEVFFSTIISLLLGFILSAIINHKIIHKFARKTHISKKSGARDVWDYVFSSTDILWINIRDIKNDIMYQGWVEAYSDTHSYNELFLKDVKVYKSTTSEYMYELPGLYITGKNNSLLIEFCQFENNNKPNKEANPDV